MSSNRQTMQMSESNEPLAPPAYSHDLPDGHSSVTATPAASPASVSAHQGPLSGFNQVPLNCTSAYVWCSQELEVSEVRWFFEESKFKGKWIPFMGADSVALETQYRVNLAAEKGVSGKQAQKVFVRGKLYEVDVVKRTINTIYWPEEEGAVMRGSWFNRKTWQPIAETSAQFLESKHAELFPYNQHVPIPARKSNEKPKSLGKVKLEDCYVEFYSPVDVHAFKQGLMSKMSRSIGVDVLGISKTLQSDGVLSRGYYEAATLQDHIPDVTHLLFVVHGIAQKPTSEFHLETVTKNQVHNMCTSTRNLVAKYQRELYPNLKDERAEFLPIEWRSKIKLDEGVLDSVTLRKMRRVRELGNASVLDVLFYTSPLYTEEILDTVVKEIHRQYDMFLQYNPDFLARGGKVSLIGHSLGSVICYDILNNYRTMDDLVTKIRNEPPEALSAENNEAMSFALKQYWDLKSQLVQAELSIAKPYFGSFKPRHLPFEVENYYAVGSPLGCFLAVRGVKPSQNGSIDNLLPKISAKRFYNLFHPYDPVAFRLEPLLLPHYRKVKPLVVHSHNQVEKPCYEDLQQMVYDDDDDATEMREVNGASSSNSSDFGTKLVTGFEKKLKSESRNVKSKVTEPFYSREGIVGNSSAQITFANDQYREMNLEFRIDYELRTQKSIVDLYSGISSAPTAHLQYWESKDSAIFFLQTLMKHLQSQPANLDPRGTSGSSSGPSAPPPPSAGGNQNKRQSLDSNSSL